MHTHVEDVPMLCESTIDAITLSVPIDSSGWHVMPNFSPAEIKLLDINGYEPGQICPKIKLCMEWRCIGSPKQERISIPISGGSITSLALLCEPNCQKQTVQNQPPLPEACEAILLLHEKPTLPLLHRLNTPSGTVINTIERIGTRSHDLSICLLIDKNGSITSNIEAQYKEDQKRITEAVLQRWLEGTGRTPYSWATLITVLREIELTVLAKEIEDNLYCT